MGVRESETRATSTLVKPFIDSDEYVLIFDYPPFALSLDNLKGLREAGVKTCWANFDWYFAEPQMGVYDWGMSDLTVERMLQADMKLILVTPATGPACLPIEWYLRTADGRVWRAMHDGYQEGIAYSELSPWNTEAMAYEHDMVNMVRARYPEAVQLINGGVHGGEALLPGMFDCWFDRSALASFNSFAQEKYDFNLAKFNRDNHCYMLNWDEARPSMFTSRAAMQYYPTTTAWLRDSLLKAQTARQKLLAQQPWHETWMFLMERNTDFAENFETGPRTGNWLAGELQDTLPDKLGTSLNLMLYEVFRSAGTQGALDIARGYESVTWTGSQFCEGLRNYSFSAISRGLRGFLTSPLHIQTGNRTLEPWMLETIKWAIATWTEARS